MSAPLAIAATSANARLWLYTPVMKPAKAAVSIMPSMPMLTTPARSEVMPARAPSVSGVALVIVIARIEMVAAGPNCTPVNPSRTAAIATQKPTCSHSRGRERTAMRPMGGAATVTSQPCPSRRSAGPRR